MNKVPLNIGKADYFHIPISDLRYIFFTLNIRIFGHFYQVADFFPTVSSLK